jgi:hypothetical protein
MIQYHIQVNRLWRRVFFFQQDDYSCGSKWQRVAAVWLGKSGCVL